MRNLLFFTIVIISLSLSLFSCGPKEEYHNVPIQFYPVYKEGDSLIYSCGNKYDTFFYESKSIIDHESDKKYHYQEYIYLLYNKNYPELVPSSQLNLTSSYIGISWLNLNKDFDYTLIPTILNLTINNVTYSNIYELNNNNSDTNYFYVKKLYFNYKYWVIRYIKNDSTTWDLIQH